MIVRDATKGDVMHVCVHMREESAAEAFASAPITRSELARLVQSISPLYALVPDKGAAAALVGISELAPGRGGIMFLATAAFPSIRFDAHRWWRDDFVRDEMMRFRRVSFIGSLPGTPSARWLEWVGFSCEGVARAHGRRGEDLAHWAWVNPCWRTIDAAAPRLACRRRESGHV